MILNYKQPHSDNSCRIDMSPVTPQRCLVDPKAVTKIALQTTTGVKKLGELFDVSPDEPDKLLLTNSHEQLDYVGAQMDSGTMIVTGNAGDYFAYQMSGGQLRLKGNAGNYLASAISNGRLDVRGNIGDYAGGARVGEMQGQHGGTVVVHGNAGKRLGDRMRRGMFIVIGNVDTYCASRMIAGNIVISGKLGAHAGMGMHRGSLIISSKTNLDIDYFSPPLEQEIIFMHLMLRHLRTLDKHFATIPLQHYIKRCIGDLTVGGLGEILIIPKL